MPARVVDEALKEAYEAQAEFRGRLMAPGPTPWPRSRSTTSWASSWSAGPTTSTTPGVNMDIPAKLRRYYGVNIIPIDFLPLWGEETRDVTPNMFWNYGRKILQAAKVVAEHPNLHIIYMTNFKCGPDSYVKHYIGAGLARSLPGAAVRRAHQRRRGHDPLRGLPRQQGLPALVGPRGRGARATGEGELGGHRDHRPRAATARPAGRRPRRRWRACPSRWPPTAPSTSPVAEPTSTSRTGCSGCCRMPYGGSRMLAAAFRSIGLDTRVTPEEDSRTLELGGKYTSGDECYPQRIVLGDYMKLLEDEKLDPKKTAFLLPTANGPCRFGQYVALLRRILDDQGYEDVAILSLHLGRRLRRHRRPGRASSSAPPGGPWWCRTSCSSCCS